MKPVLYTLICILLLNIISCSSCKKTVANTILPPCGCDSPVIQKADSLRGILQYSSKENKYQISDGSSDYSNLYFICDTTYLPLKSIIGNNYHTINCSVLFAGDLHAHYSASLFYISFTHDIKLSKIIKQ